MHGNEDKQQAVRSHVSLEERVPADHPLRPYRGYGSILYWVNRGISNYHALLGSLRFQF